MSVNRMRLGEFAKLGLDFELAPAMTDEAIEILLEVWTRETASYDGKFWRFPELSLRPRVYQRPHLPLHMVASRPASEARVGAGGWPVAMHFTPTDAVARCVEEYRGSVASATSVTPRSVARAVQPRGHCHSTSVSPRAPNLPLMIRL